MVHVHSLLTPVWEGASRVEVDDTGFSGCSYWSKGAGGVLKRMRLTRKMNSSELRRFGDSSNLHSKKMEKALSFWGCA